MAKPADIGRVGEAHVVRWLQQRGYWTNWDTKAPGATDIEARGIENLLVQVKAAVQPDVPAALSPAEVSAIKERAARIGFSVYSAGVTLDRTLRLVGEVQWVKLA